jgi:ABC-type transporter Mla MlaB component
MFEWTAAVDVASDKQAPGCVLTVVKRDEVLVWLIGEIDVSVALDLAQIAEHAPRVADRLVIDASRVTFCDSTIAHFLDRVADAMPVVVRRPSQLFADFLAATGLYPQVFVQTEDSLP